MGAGGWLDERTDAMSENSNNNNNNNVFADERDAQLWATARKSARLANTYGLKTTTVLARLAASRVLGGDDVSALATMVADDPDMQAAGVKASSIRAYGAPLKRLATVLSVGVYEALLIGDAAVTVTTADKWTRDPSMTSAKIDKALAGHEINRADIAARMAALIPSPDADKGDADKGDADKSDADKGDADKGDADKSDADKGDADKSDADKSDADKGDADKGDADKGDADKGDADKGDADKSDADKSDPYDAAIVMLADAGVALVKLAEEGKLKGGRGRMALGNVDYIRDALMAALAIRA